MGFEFLGQSFALSPLGLVIRKLFVTRTSATMDEILWCYHSNEALLEEQFAKSYSLLGILQNEV